MTEKQRVRKAGIDARRAMTAGERKAASAAIARSIAGSEAFRKAGTILIYRAMPDEVDLSFLTELPESRGKRFCYPRILEKRQMEALVPSGPDGWTKGSFGITEPDPATAAPVEQGELDLVLCPCTAFDVTGERMGMGGGYYDRYLPGCTRAAIAAVAFERQKVPVIPTEETDIRMGMVFTDAAVYPPGDQQAAE